MTLRRPVVVFMMLWVPLALWQCVRTASICHDGSGGSTLLWGLQLAMLAAPLAVLRRLSRRVPGSLAAMDDDVVAVILVAYVPLTLALRLAERCAP
jgi:hypothetical protein